MKKALALLLAMLLTVSLSSVAFADEPVSSAVGEVSGLGEPYGQLPAVPVASGGTPPPPPESSVPEVESSEPESSEPESVSSEPESSEPESSEPESSRSESSVSEPESSVSTSESESSEPESSEPEITSSESESSDESSEPDNTPADTGKQPDDMLLDDIPYEPEDTGDLFGARMGIVMMSAPVIHVTPPATVIGEDPLVAVNTGTTNNGSAWTPSAGIPDLTDGATITSSTSLIFAIPDDNFATSATTGSSFDAKLASLNTPAFKGLVKVLEPSGTDRTSSFDIQFVRVAATGSGRAFGVQLTPNKVTSTTGELSLPAGTSFGFASQTTSPYRLRNSLLIVPSSSSSSKATGITDGAELGGRYTWITKNGSTYTGGIDEIDDAYAGDEFLIHFSPQFFEWDGTTPAKVTMTNIRSKISLRQTGTTSSRIFEAVELASSKGEAVVRIKFRDDLTSVKPIDFKTTIYLTVKGKRHDDSSLAMTGTFGDVEPEEFYSEDWEIDISDGILGQAMETMSRVKVYIGEGITLNVPSIRKNSKFYGTVSTDFDKADEALVEQYPDIILAYTLHTLGLSGAGVTVDIDTYNGYYLYDKDLNYLGQSTKKLEYSEKYYLAASMLDIETEDEDEEYPDDEDWQPENDTPPSGNPNKNPGTGR